MPLASAVLAAVTAEADRAPPPGVEELARTLAARWPEQVLGALFYGSCRRDVAVGDGLVDLYLVVDDLAACAGPVAALLGRALPPNVFYAEVPTSAGVLRCKFGLVPVAALEWRASRGFHPYFRARLAQPMGVLATRSAADRRRLLQVLGCACVAFWQQALPMVPDGACDALTPWRVGLGCSYRAELRTEQGRPGQLVAAWADWYRELARVMPLAGLASRASSGGLQVAVPRRDRWLAGAAWQARIGAGKLLSVLRLVKGLYTFDGALDYIAWKLARHSGQPVTIPDHVRRWPLLFIWPLMLRLYRRGVFR